MGEGAGPGLVGDALCRAKKVARGAKKHRDAREKNRDTHFCCRPGEHMSGRNARHPLIDFQSGEKCGCLRLRVSGLLRRRSRRGESHGVGGDLESDIVRLACRQLNSRR